MKPTEFLTGIILLLCVSGCSKSIPSDEDAKKAISNLTGGCEYLSRRAQKPSATFLEENVAWENYTSS